MAGRTSPRKRFGTSVLALLEGGRMLSVRAGTGDHRFTGIWFVLVGGRLLVRPYYDSATGWRRVFLRDPRGTILVGKREIAVRARSVRGERIYDAMDRAYAQKYATPASRKWVRGFARPSRRKTTIELTPRQPPPRIQRSSAGVSRISPGKTGEGR